MPSNSPSGGHMRTRPNRNRVLVFQPRRKSAPSFLLTKKHQSIWWKWPKSWSKAANPSEMENYNLAPKTPKRRSSFSKKGWFSLQENCPQMWTRWPRNDIWFPLLCFSFKSLGVILGMAVRPRHASRRWPRSDRAAVMISLLQTNHEIPGWMVLTQHRWAAHILHVIYHIS